MISTIDKHKYEPWGFYFGGIDCRECIFTRSIEDFSSILEVTEEICRKYLEFMQILSAVYDVSTISCPPQGCKRDKKVSFFATQEIRQGISAKFNACLKVMGKEMGVKNINPWVKMGGTKKDLTMDKYFADGIVLKDDYASAKLDEYLTHMK